MRRIRSYKEALSFLYNQLPMHQRIGPKAIKKDLKNIKLLMDLLDNPQEKTKYIHVGGTNGKGSVSHIMASIFQESGYKVGLYTSPHYKDFRERVKVNGQLIGKREVVGFVNEMASLKVIQKLKPSFFEISVALAFHHFNKQKVDIAVIEVGLGGRLDSTNIITPELSIITNIGYDHQATLGNTLTEIAGEKAGIIKKGVPVVIGEYQIELADIFIKKAKQQGSILHFAKDLKTPSIPAIRLMDPFFKKNAKTAFAASGIISKQWNLKKQDVIKGVRKFESNSFYIGRVQELAKEPTVLADSAHNLEGLQILFSAVNKMKYNTLHIILAMVGDKPLDKVLQCFPNQAKYYFSKANIPRGKLANELKEEANLYGMEGKVYLSVRKALASAKQSADKNDLILVTGSIYTVAEVI